MNKEKMFALNTPTMELQVELSLATQGRCDEIVRLVSQGWGIYPEVLNTLIALNWTVYVHRIMSAVSPHDKYPLESMQQWMEAYYGQNWKYQVVQFGLKRISDAYLSDNELTGAKLIGSASQENEFEQWEDMARKHGMHVVKETYMSMRNQLHQGSPAEEVAKVNDVERFLLFRGEYEYLYQKEAWRTLISSLEGCRYIAETKHYMRGLAEALMSYEQTMSKEAVSYCLEKLDATNLDDGVRDRYHNWRTRHA